MLSALYPQSNNQISGAIVQTSAFALSGALAGYVFNIVSPVGGAVFAVTSRLCVDLTLISDLNNFRDSKVEKVTKFVISWFAVVLAAMGATWLCGYPITFLGSNVLQIILIPIGREIFNPAPLFLLTSSINYLKRSFTPS
jgi:hypothetical protein